MNKLSLLLLPLCLYGNAVSAQVVFGDDEKNYVISGPMDAPRVVYQDKDSSDPVVQAKEKLGYKISRFRENWFAVLSGGFSSFVNAPNSSTDFSGRTNALLQLNIGKWHTPFLGNRLSFQGFKFTDYTLRKQNYQSIHFDQLFNVSSFFRDDFSAPYKWNVYPFIGAGIIHNSTLKTNPFAFSYGIVTGYNIAQKLALSLEIGGTTSFQTLDGIGKKNHFGDHLLYGSIGLQYNIGRQGFNHRRTAKKMELSESDSYAYPVVTRIPSSYKGLESLNERINKGETSVRSDNFTSGVDGEVYGSPILFFFKKNTAKLIDSNQKVNLKELAGFMKQNNLCAKIIGAADSKTGTTARNRSLSISRALYIARYLRSQGINKSRLYGVSQGGINMYRPTSANRHTCVILFKKK